MKKLVTAFTVVVFVSSVSYASAQNQLETTLDLMVRGMMDDGAMITYDERIIGTDGSVEYIDLVIAAPDGEITLTMDWLKGVPSGSNVTFTVANVIRVSGLAEGVDFAFDIQSSGFELSTNGLLREAMSTEAITVSFAADEFIVNGGDPDSETIRKLFLDMGAVDFNLLVSTEGSDWLGSGTLSNFRKFRSFKEARKFARSLNLSLFGRISGSILRRSFERPCFEGIPKENARLLFDCDIVGAPFVPCWSGLTSDGDELSNPSSRPRRSPRVTDSSAHSYNAPQYYPLILPKTLKRRDRRRFT